MKKMFFLLAFILTVQSQELVAQTRSSVAFFKLINTSKKSNKNLADAVNGPGWLQYGDSLIVGEFMLSGNGLYVVDNTSREWFSYADPLVRKIVIKKNGDSLYLNRLGEYDNQLWKLIKAALGIEIYDKKYSFNTDETAIDYNSLLFRQNSRYCAAQTFWVTSTKRQIIKILNSFLGLNLSYKNFHSKEDIMKMIVHN